MWAFTYVCRLGSWAAAAVSELALPYHLRPPWEPSLVHYWAVLVSGPLQPGGGSWLGCPSFPPPLSLPPHLHPKPTLDKYLNLRYNKKLINIMDEHYLEPPSVWNKSTFSEGEAWQGFLGLCSIPRDRSQIDQNIIYKATRTMVVATQWCRGIVQIFWLTTKIPYDLSLEHTSANTLLLKCRILYLYWSQIHPGYIRCLQGHLELEIGWPQLQAS